MASGFEAATHPSLLLLHVAVALAAVRLAGHRVIRVLAVELGDALHVAAPRAGLARLA